MTETPERTRMGDRTMTDDPYNPTTIGGWIRSFMLARQLEADYTDQAAIDRDYARMAAASDARDAQFWADMRADGIPVADSEPYTKPGSFADRYEAAVAEAQADQRVADYTPAREVAGCESEADAAPELEWEAEL